MVHVVLAADGLLGLVALPRAWSIVAAAHRQSDAAGASLDIAARGAYPAGIQGIRPAPARAPPVKLAPLAIQVNPARAGAGAARWGL